MIISTYEGWESREKNGIKQYAQKYSRRFSPRSFYSEKARYNDKSINSINAQVIQGKIEIHLTFMD